MRHRMDTEAFSRLFKLALYRVVFDPFQVCRLFHGFADGNPLEIGGFLGIEPGRMLFCRGQWQEAHASMELPNGRGGRNSVDIALKDDHCLLRCQSEHRNRPVCCLDRNGNAGADSEVGGLCIEGPLGFGEARPFLVGTPGKGLS